MAKEIKVFGGTIFYGSPRKQVRIIIGAYTKKQALELVNTINTFSNKHFNDYFSQTGNSIESLFRKKNMEIQFFLFQQFMIYTKFLFIF